MFEERAGIRDRPIVDRRSELGENEIVQKSGLEIADLLVLRRKALWAYRIRNLGSIFGFASLVAGKILTLYAGSVP